MFLKSNGGVKKYLIIFLVSFLVIMLLPAASFAASRVDVSGFVRDDLTGNPLSNARVDLFYDTESVPFISIYSDGNGRVEAAVYASRTIKRAEIARAGYKRASYTIPGYYDSIDLGTKYLVEGTDIEGIYRVYGTVVDYWDGSSVSDVKVTLVDSYERITYSGYTNSRGRFDVINLPLGDYEVCVTKYGYRDYKMSSLLRLRMGDLDIGTIRLEKTGTATSSPRTLKGRITDENGYYLQGAAVYLIDGAGDEIKTKTDAAGYYSFRDIEAGTYTIGVDAPGYELLERIDFVRMLSTDSEREINLIVVPEIRRGYDVYGRVVDANREYVEGVEVSLIDGNTRIKRATTDSKGYYEFRYVPNGRYAVEFKKIGFQTLVLPNEIRVDGSYFPVPQAELSESKGNVSVIGGLVGVAHSGLGNFAVYLENEANRYEAVTNYFGFFTFNDVREGSYNLYANVDKTKKLLETGVRVAGAKVDTGDINVNRIGSGYKITGNIRDAGNYNIGNAKVTVTAGGVKKETVTDSSGSYYLSGLERGEYIIAAAKDGYGAASEKITITSYDLNKDFILKPNDFIKVNFSDIKLAVNERASLSRYISNVEIYSSKGILLDNITTRYEASVLPEYSDYLAVYSDNEIMGKKAGNAYIEISIRNSGDYENLSPALLSVAVTESAAPAKKAVLTIGTNSYTLDGKRETSDAVPYIKENRSFFPLRVMAKVLGVTEKNIKWDPATHTATLIKGSDTVEFTVGKKNY